jgi:hypothetical protein
MLTDRFCLPDGYRARLANNEGLQTTDHAQRAVYEYAARIAAVDPQVVTVLDWGTGSGCKLIECFGHLDTLGVDVAWRLPTLTSRYPQRRWGVCPVPIDADMVLCVDVIEHLDDPVELLQKFAAGSWRHLVISTPERQLVASRKRLNKRQKRQQLAGPPINRWHTREWTCQEFSALLLREFCLVPQVTLFGKWNLAAHIQKSSA